MNPRVFADIQSHHSCVFVEGLCVSVRINAGDNEKKTQWGIIMKPESVITTD